MKKKDVFFGLSIFKPRFLHIATLEKDISTIKDHNLDYFILIADLPEIYNLTTIEKLTNEEAKRRIAVNTQIIINNLKQIDSKIEFYRWESIKKKITSYRTEIEKIITTDQDIHALLMQTVKNNLRNRYKLLKKSEIITLSQYLIDELAQTWYFFDNKIVTFEAYPSSMPPIKQKLFFDKRYTQINYQYINLLDPI